MVDLTLSTLTVVNKADRLGRDEPMLWTWFFELSVATLNSHQFIVTTDPVKGRLAKAGKGDTVNIPASVGRYHRDTGRVFMAGVIAAAFENDGRTNKQIKDGYAAGAATLNQAVLNHFATYGFADVSAGEEAVIGDQVAEAVKKAVIAAHGVVVAALGGTTLGSDKHMRKLLENSISENVVLNFKAKKDRAVYRVNGKLTFDR